MQRQSCVPICALCVFISMAVGCAVQPRSAAPPQWPATWSGRKIFNVGGALVYARDGSDADEFGHVVSDVGRAFHRRTGVQPSCGLLIVSDVQDSKLGDFPPEQLLPPDKKKTDLLEMGFTLREVALAQPLPMENNQLTGDLGFSPQAAATVSWALAVPSDRRTDQFIHHTIDAGMDKQKINFAQRILLLPFMPMINGLVVKMLATQRDIVIYDRLCAAQSTWDPARRKREADRYSAARMKSLANSMGATTQETAEMLGGPEK